MTTTFLSNSNDNSPNNNQPCYFLNENSAINIIPDTSSVKNKGSTVNKEKRDLTNMGGILQFDLPKQTQWISACKPTGIPSISPTNRLHFEDLPEDIHRVEPDQLESLLNEEELIIFDIRPFNMYSISRIKGAINMCVPTTLLKRNSFNIPQMLNSTSMPLSLKDLTLLKITSNNCSAPMKVLVYDSDSCDSHTSFLLYKTCMKFRWYNQDGSRRFDIYFLNNGFADVSKLASFMESDSSTSFNATSPNVKQLSNLSGFQLPSCTPSNQKFLSSIKKNNLPKLSISATKDNTNDNDNDNDIDINDNLDSYHYNFRLPDISKHESKKLPVWLQFFTKNKDSSSYTKDILKTINFKFNKIEKSEQARLKTAITNHCPDNHVPNICSPSALCPGCDSTYYKIPKGIEYGFKNRYNNIWPYEHSRVKLIKSPNPLKLDDYDDYFNANYISFPKISNFKYIATQNPLQATYEDFWKTIWSNQINIIICLNVQLPANLVGQDRKYFDDQEFKRSGIKITNNELIEQDCFNIRKLTLAKDNKARPIYHLEYKDWPDFGVPSSFDSIIKLIDYKKKIIKTENLNEQALVHCLAGCGRTGCFITLDMALDCFNNFKSGNLNPWMDDDLIYKAVQYQRTQRISMVQNLDQFIFCYEFILNYVVRNLI